MDHNNRTLAANAVDARPSKAFFIETLPRDITLSDSILDLVDNSIHRLITGLDLDLCEYLFTGTVAATLNAVIDITFGPSSFSITDDCGGISINDAKEQVFRFGEPVKAAKRKPQTGLGVYGIGMKRAFFKIGRQISIHSQAPLQRV